MVPFIVGAPRSGTTLLRLMLDAHPRLAIPPETGFLPAALRLGWWGAWGDPRERLLRLITSFSSWPDFHLDATELRESFARIEPFVLVEGVRAFYRLYARRFEKPLWGDKTPAYGLRMARIGRLLPEACFIHLVRDGRDVALSLRPLWFAPSRRIDKLAASWAKHVRGTRAQARAIRHYLEVRYEDLVREPEPSLRRICHLLELDFAPEMLRYHERAASRLDEHEERRRRDGTVLVSKEERRRQQWRTRLPLDASRVGQFWGELSRRELEVFERVAGDLLRELGYPEAARALPAVV